MKKAVIPPVFMLLGLVSLFAVGYFWLLGGILFAVGFLICAYAVLLSNQKDRRQPKHSTLKK